MSTVFLFGAGASAFSGDCFPKNPPLGCALFAELQRTGGVAASAGHDLAQLFADDFESGMAEFRRRHEVETVGLLREMAKYFAQFEPRATNHYRYLVRTLKQASIPSVLATLNYDLLIELAICREGRLVSYSGLPVPPDNFPVLKLHGSCNFLPDLGGGGMQNIRFYVPPGASILDAPIRPVDVPELLQFCEAPDNALAPAMAVYAKGKDVLFGRRFIRTQQESWRAAVEVASQLFVIGVRVHPSDEHVWEPLAASETDLFYVGPDANPFHDWTNERGRQRAVHLADSFEAALPLIHRKLVGR